MSRRAAASRGLFDFLSVVHQSRMRQAPQSNVFATPSVSPASRAPPRAAWRFRPAFCVDSCDRRYFPLMRGSARRPRCARPSVPRARPGSSAPADSASAGRRRYCRRENAFLYAGMRANCTCKAEPRRAGAGRLNPDTRSVATWSPPPTGCSPIPAAGAATARPGILTPIASYPGLTGRSPLPAQAR